MRKIRPKKETFSIDRIEKQFDRLLNSFSKSAQDEI